MNAECGTRNAGSLALVALGSNLGDSVAVLRQAMERLEELSAAPLLRSSLWDTTPVDCPLNSPRFVNAAVALVARADETAEGLLMKLQGLEKAFGRQPKLVLNEARALDLDLIAFGCERHAAPGLTLPHPRAHLRRFVLQPLAEIAPEFVLPGQSCSILALLESLRTDERVARLG